jgi:hypothetical protein
MMDFEDVSNEDIQKAIDLWIHSERDRIILKLRLIDGYTYMQISDYLYEHQDKVKKPLSSRQISNIVSDAEQKLFKHLK